MAAFPKSEWDLFLQSPMRLSEGVGLRFELKRGRCLHDRRSAWSWGLEPWQSQFLQELEGGASFSEIVHDVVSACPETATREAILELVTGLRRHGLLTIEKPRHARVVKSFSRSESSQRAGLGTTWMLLSSRWFWSIATGVALVVAALWGFQEAFSSRRIPTERRGEAVVRRSGERAEEVPVRASHGGVITEILVLDGDRVKRGDVVVWIADPVARSTRDGLRRRLGDCRTRRDRRYLADDWEGYQRESRAIARLTRELSEWEQRSDAVAMRSPVDGHIDRGTIPEVIGTVVEPGKILMTVRRVVDDGTGGGREEFLAGVP